MFALTEKALASSELSNNKIDPIQMYVKNSSKARPVTRRASLTAAPAQHYGDQSHGGGGGGGGDDAKSIRSARSSRSRRASMSGAAPVSMMGPAYGYGGDDDDSTEDERSVYSSRSRRNNRRTSLSGALPSMMDAGDGYGRDKDEDVPVYTNRPARRTSVTGSKMSRRGSASRGTAGGKMSRRGSSGNNGAADMQPASRMATRRGSAGFGAGYGHGNANAHVPMQRRMSNGMPMPRRMSSTSKERIPQPAPQPAPPPPHSPTRESAAVAMMPTELRLFKTTDSVMAGNSHRSAGVPVSPRMERNTTADSFEMRQMVQAVGNKVPSFTRRGGRRNELNEEDDVESGSVSSNKNNAAAEAEQAADDKFADDNFQPLQRNNTVDSFDLMAMAQGARTTAKTGVYGGAGTRRGGRGGRRGANNDIPAADPVEDKEDEKEADAKFQPLHRNNTADSVDMKQMAQAAIQRNNTADSVDMKQMAHAARVPPQAAGARTRRGGRRGADNEAPPSPVGGRRATLARHGTADSMTMAQMGRSASKLEDGPMGRSASKLEDVNGETVEGPQTSIGVIHLSADEVGAGTDDTGNTGEAKTGATRRGGRRGENVERRRIVCRTGTNDSLGDMRTSLKRPTDDEKNNDKDPEEEKEAETEIQEKYETPARVFDGINPDVLARMSHAASGSVDQEVSDLEDDGTDNDDEQEDPYGYGKTDTTSVYGYGNDAPSDSEVSQSSRRSGRSNKSMRRNSTIIRPDANNSVVSQLLTGPPRVSDSDLEDGSELTGSGEDSPATGSMYGYGPKTPYAAPYASAQDSGNESEGTSKSMSSARRTRRRNSCLIRPERDQTVTSSLLQKASPMSDRDMEPDEDDFNDPDSLLNKSGFGSATPKKPRSFESEEEDPLDEVKVTGINLSSSNTAIKAKPMAKQKTPWRNREQPFTSPRQVLTKEKLEETEKQRINGQVDEIPDTRGNWGDVDLSMSDDESPSDSSKESYGASLYVDKEEGYRDIDRYKQKARRRASLELTCIDIAKYEPPQLKTSKLSKFTPAVGCTNASDFLVRCFAARLRAGITVIKHNRSRWSKSHLRTLFLLPDGKTLSWRAAEGENLKGEKGKRPKLDLIRCVEVRHAWSRDPSTKKLTGTAVMRKRCKDGLASRSFALIYNKRTLDMTALTTDQCKLLMEGFTALCFRLHLEREDDSQPDGGGSRGENSRSGDDDWASTVYGSTASLSLTATTTANPLSPWGL